MDRESSPARGSRLGTSGRARASLLLGTLASLFLVRVAGQLVALRWAPAILPPFDAWYSGLVPYGVLLPVQVVILVLQGWVAIDVSRGGGRFFHPSVTFGRRLRRIALFYFLVMLARYLFTMAIFPEMRWNGGAIPVAFHWVLAAFLFVLGREHEARAGETASVGKKGERARSPRPHSPSRALLARSAS